MKKKKLPPKPKSSAEVAKEKPARGDQARFRQLYASSIETFRKTMRFMYSPAAPPTKK